MSHIIMISNLLLSLPITFPQSICHPALVHPSRFAFLRCKMTWATMCFDIIMMSKHIHFVQKPCCTWWVLLVQFESTFPRVIFPSKFCSPIKSDRRLALTLLPISSHRTCAFCFRSWNQAAAIIEALADWWDLRSRDPSKFPALAFLPPEFAPDQTNPRYWPKMCIKMAPIRPPRALNTLLSM